LRIAGPPQDARFLLFLSEHFWTAKVHIYEKISSIPLDDAFEDSTFRLDIQQMGADKMEVALLLRFKRLETKGGMLKNVEKKVKVKM
jgi:hypothetical protein